MLFTAQIDWTNRPTLFCVNDESADVTRNIVVAWSLRFPRSATAIVTPESRFQCGRYCYALPYHVYVCSGGVIFFLRLLRGSGRFQLLPSS